MKKVFFYIISLLTFLTLFGCENNQNEVSIEELSYALEEDNYEKFSIEYDFSFYYSTPLGVTDTKNNFIAKMDDKSIEFTKRQNNDFTETIYYFEKDNRVYRASKLNGEWKTSTMSIAFLENPKEFLDFTEYFDASDLVPSEDGWYETNSQCAYKFTRLFASTINDNSIKVNKFDIKLKYEDGYFVEYICDVDIDLNLSIPFMQDSTMDSSISSSIIYKGSLKLTDIGNTTVTIPDDILSLA